MKRLGASIPVEQRKSVLFVSSMDGYTGTGSLFDDMCKYMSIYNAPDLLGLPPRTPFGDERVIAMEPDYIFIPSYKGMDKTLASRYLDNPAFQNLSVEKIPHKAGTGIVSIAHIKIIVETIPVIRSLHHILPCKV